MNLNVGPTLVQLQILIANGNDDDGHHILWVDNLGKVHLSLLPAHLTPNGFQDTTLSMRVRYETSDQGNGYVGPTASKDTEYVTRLFNSLVSTWKGLTPGGRVEYVDIW